jgi:CubicO group peptidase (beta-lactamase class C family)
MLALVVASFSLSALAMETASTSGKTASMPLAERLTSTRGTPSPAGSAGGTTPSLLAPESAAQTAFAATASAGVSAARAQAAIDPASLAAFVDGVVRSYMTDKGIAGVTVAVTSREGSLLVRGYGIADDQPQRKVDPRWTLFRIGSISKTFTYVATMQLLAAHKLDLDAPIDRYLPTSLKTDSPRYPPIRIWNLMTHTAGFEDAALSAHMFYADPRKVPQLDVYLARYRPERVRAPAVHADYSNYSVELLGAIVQQVSGEPFDEYIEKHILEPLRMRHTTFRELLPKSDPRAVTAGLAGDFSTAFQYQNGGFVQRGTEYISNGAPAGAGSSDAADMETWMRMLLNDGVVDGREILDPATFHEMVTPNFRNAPAVRAIAHGFFVGRYGRYSSLEHDGDTLWFHSNLVVLPQAGVGVFVSTNTDTGSSLVAALPRLIFEQFLPGARPSPAPPPPERFTRSGQVYAGTYLSERRNFSTIEKLLSTNTANVIVTPDGYLAVNGGKGGRWVEQSPDIFREVNNSDRLQFLRDARGRVLGMAVANGDAVFDKAGFFDDPRTAFATLALLLVLCTGALVGTWGRRGQLLRGPLLQGRGERGSAWTLLAAVCGWLLFLLLIIATAVVMSAAGYKLLFDFPPPVLLAMVVMGYVASVLTLTALWFLPSVWRMQAWFFWRKLRHSLIVASMVWTIVLLIEWKALLSPLVL